MLQLGGFLAVHVFFWACEGFTPISCTDKYWLIGNTFNAWCVLTISLNNTKRFWFHVLSFVCIHLTLERIKLRCFVYRFIRSSRLKRTKRNFKRRQKDFINERWRSKSNKVTAGQTVKRVRIPEELLWNELMYENACDREYEAISDSQCIWNRLISVACDRKVIAE